MATCNRFIERALESAGIPVLPVYADMVDAQNWDGEDMRRRGGEFIEERLS